MRPSRLWTLLLLPGGLAAGHLLGYGAVRAQGLVPSLDGGHGYVHALGMLAVPFTLAALLRVGVSGARRERAPVGFTGLAVQQVLAYVFVEVAEHAAAGIGPSVSLREPTMIWGIVAQLLVAGVVALLVRGVRTAAQRLTVQDQPTLVAAPEARLLLPTRLRAVSPAVALSSLSRRGPPQASF